MTNCHPDLDLITEYAAGVITTDRIRLRVTASLSMPPLRRICKAAYRPRREFI